MAKRFDAGKLDPNDDSIIWDYFDEEYPPPPRMKRPPPPPSTPRDLFAEVLNCFKTTMTFNHGKNKLHSIADEITPAQVIECAKLRLKAASELIKYCVPALKASANLTAETDMDVIAGLLNQDTAQLQGELKELESNEKLPPNTLTSAMDIAVETVADVEACRVDQNKPSLIFDAKTAMKVAAKKPSRTSGSPRRKS